MTRIAIISDIHFGRDARIPEFQVPGNLSKNVDTGAEPFEEGLKKLLREMKPDYFFVSGDLTSVGEPQEFYYCEKKILELANSIQIESQNIICGLGNHDIDWNISQIATEKIEREKSMISPEVAELITEKYQRIAANSGTQCMELIQQPEERGPVPFSGIVKRDDFIVFVLNTGWMCVRSQKYSHGKLSDKQLKWFEKCAKEYKDDNRTKIVLMHHHPMKYSYPTLTEDISLMEESAEFMDIVGSNRINIVIHGHRHHPRTQTMILRNGSLPVAFICAGSLSVNPNQRENGDIPNTIHFLEIDKNKDYYMLYNYKYTGAAGWEKIDQNNKETPMDPIMKIGKVFSEIDIKNAIKSYLAVKDFIHLEWEELDECLQFMPCNELNDLFREILAEKFYISGFFPESVSLVAKNQGAS